MRVNPIAVVVALVALQSCTWVEPDAAGSAVRVAYRADDVAACKRLGEVTVSVRENVAGISRSDIKVRDELESLARNEGATLGASHVFAVAEPLAGQQRFEAYACR